MRCVHVKFEVPMACPKVGPEQVRRTEFRARDGYVIDLADGVVTLTHPSTSHVIRTNHPCWYVPAPVESKGK